MAFETIIEMLEDLKEAISFTREEKLAEWSNGDAFDADPSSFMRQQQRLEAALVTAPGTLEFTAKELRGGVDAEELTWLAEGVAHLRDAFNKRAVEKEREYVVVDRCNDKYLHDEIESEKRLAADYRSYAERCDVIARKMMKGNTP